MVPRLILFKLEVATEKHWISPDVLNGHLTKGLRAPVLIASNLVGDGMKHAVAIRLHLDHKVVLRPQHVLESTQVESSRIGLLFVCGDAVDDALVYVLLFLAISFYFPLFPFISPHLTVGF